MEQLDLEEIPCFEDSDSPRGAELARKRARALLPELGQTISGDTVPPPRGDPVAPPRGDPVPPPRGDPVAPPRGDPVLPPRGDVSEIDLDEIPEFAEEDEPAATAAAVPVQAGLWKREQAPASDQRQVDAAGRTLQPHMEAKRAEDEPASAARREEGDAASEAGSAARREEGDAASEAGSAAGREEGETLELVDVGAATERGAVAGARRASWALKVCAALEEARAAAITSPPLASPPSWVCVYDSFGMAPSQVEAIRCGEPLPAGHWIRARDLPAHTLEWCRELDPAGAAPERLLALSQPCVWVRWSHLRVLPAAPLQTLLGRVRASLDAVPSDAGRAEALCARVDAIVNCLLPGLLRDPAAPPAAG
jgi:hypothetical protein